MKIPEKLKSRKLWLAVLAGSVVFINKLFDLDLKVEEIIAIISPIMLWIGVQGAADIKATRPK